MFAIARVRVGRSSTSGRANHAHFIGGRAVRKLPRSASATVAQSSPRRYRSQLPRAYRAYVRARRTDGNHDGQLYTRLDFYISDCLPGSPFLTKASRSIAI